MGPIGNTIYCILVMLALVVVYWPYEWSSDDYEEEW